MKVSFPAKIILLGEHAVVYPGNTACLSALDLYTTADYTESNDENFQVSFTSKTFNVSTSFSIATAQDTYRKCQLLHQEFLQSGDISQLKNLIKGQGNFFKLIAGYLLNEYPNIQPLTVTMHCQAPLGSGMGTSASIAATMIQSVLDFNNIIYSHAILLKHTQQIEDMQHGRSSGADPAAVIHKSLLAFKHNLDGTRTITVLKKSQHWTANLHLILSGNPQESTGEMVSKVREYKNNNPQRFNWILKQINNIVNDFIKSDEPDMNSLINANGLLLEEIGVVSKQARAFSQEVRQAGGAVKIAGAGGIAMGSGICLIHMENLAKLKKLLIKYNYTLIPAHFII